MATPAKRPTVILFADDDADDRDLMREAFAEAAEEVDFHTVDDGVELMDALRGPSDSIDGIRPDVLLLDLNMPRKNGYAALAEMKADPELRKFPVVIFSTSSSNSDVQFALEHSAASYVVKPTDYDSLLKFVSDLTSYWCFHDTFVTQW
jgi:CheY-like chemotaxis protein